MCLSRALTEILALFKNGRENLALTFSARITSDYYDENSDETCSSTVRIISDLTKHFHVPWDVTPKHFTSL